MQKGFTRNFEPIRILRENQVEQIHKASLNVLNEVGFKFDSDKALKLLEENGCKVDYNSKIAKIPSNLVEECIRKTPSSFVLRARDPNLSISVGGNTIYFMNSAGARYTDIDTGEVSMPTLEQNNTGVLVSDALSSVHVFPSYTPYFEIEVQ